MKRFFLLLCLLCMTACTAYADTVYQVLPYEMDDAVMTALALGEKADQAVRTEQTEGAVLYHLPGSNSAPFFCTDLYSPVQLGISLYTAEGATQKYVGRLGENIVASGIAPCALTRAEALTQAEALLQRSGLTDRALLSVTAYGRFSETTPFYQIRFLQTLNDRPIYWSAFSMQKVMTDIHFSSNSVSVILGDHGLVSIVGNWSKFVPTGTEQASIPESEAMQTLIAAGEAPEKLESCYLMVFDGVNATASPAYRWQNRFVNALNGELLQ